jgi:AraC-like DNA-binding protein
MTHAACAFAVVTPVDPANRCPLHEHDCTEIVHVGDSSGLLMQDRTVHRFSRGDVFCYQPGGLHTVRIERPGAHTCIGVVGCGAEKLRTGVWKAPPAAARWFAALRESLADASPSRGEALDLLAGMVVLSLRDLEQRGAEPGSKAAKARSLIDRRFSEPLTPAEIAAGLYISPRHLRQVFRQEFGLSPLAYLVNRRIDEAKRLLAASDRPIQAVAEACGFGDAFYFSRVFRKVVGASPSAYRTRQRRRG